MINNIAVHYLFINNVMGAYVRSLADFFKNDMYPRSKDIVIATYEKAIEYIRNRKKNCSEHHSPAYPFLTLDPGMDNFEPESLAGKFLHQYPNFDQGLAVDLWGPVLYEDHHIKIAPVVNRYRGNMELIIWCGSIYEAIDLRTYTYQIFGGVDRPIFPVEVDSFISLPDNLSYYSYDNPYTAEKYFINWENNNAFQQLVKNINKNMWVYPISFRPYIKLTDIGDASDKYGGADDISEYRLSINMEWESGIPTHLAIRTNLGPRVHKVMFEMVVSSGYRKITGDNDEIYGIAPIEKTVDVIGPRYWRDEKKIITETDITDMCEYHKNIYIDLEDFPLKDRLFVFCNGKRLIRLMPSSEKNIDVFYNTLYAEEVAKCHYFYDHNKNSIVLLYNSNDKFYLEDKNEIRISYLTNIDKKDILTYHLTDGDIIKLANGDNIIIPLNKDVDINSLEVKSSNRILYRNINWDYKNKNFILFGNSFYKDFVNSRTIKIYYNEITIFRKFKYKLTIIDADKLKNGECVKIRLLYKLKYLETIQIFYDENHTLINGDHYIFDKKDGIITILPSENLDYLNISDILTIVYVKDIISANSRYVTQDTKIDKIMSYSFTEDDILEIKDGGDISINIKENIKDCSYVKIYCKYGTLNYCYQWNYAGNGIITILNTPDLYSFNSGDVLTIVLYKDVEATN